MPAGDPVQPLGPGGGAGPPERLEILKRRLERERIARAEAETITERATRELYDKQQELILLELIAKTANEASDAGEAMSAALDAIREHHSWPLGHAWRRREGDEVISTGLWSGKLERFAELVSASEGLVLAAGVGLPGRVLSECRPVWMSGASALRELPGGTAIAEAGIRTALCFPLLAGADVVGVLEFFTEREFQPDAELLGLMAQAGTQMGRAVERQRAQEALHHEATHDALTGLPNRRMILDRLRRALSRQRRRSGEQTAVLFLDLDGFKSVNDTLGHAAGDRVLRQVAERLATVLRPHDTLGRLSGDEFVAVCEALTVEHPAAAIAGRLNEVMREPFVLDGEQFVVTVSIGIALAAGPEDPLRLIEQADAAMYRSKELGRGRYEVFSDALRERIARRLALERGLRHAVERDELVLHFQPEVDLGSGAVIGVEALLRWQRDEGLMMPDSFIPIAEETGLIVPIGAWVLGDALRQAGVWRADPAIAEAPWTSVNLSVRQLSDPDLIETVSTALASSAGGSSDLFLEVTESLILSEAEAGLAVLSSLKHLGTEIAIDDFGTGYASLSYLQRFPASILKIDQAFIASIADDPRTEAIVSAIIEMAHALGLRAVAEGIETGEQLAAVRGLGCDIGQGFYFARPAPALELEPLLTSERPFARLVGRS